MTIAAESWSAYTAKLERINKKAAGEAKRILASFGGELTEDAITAITAAVTKYGEAAAALACQIYDEIAEAQGVLLLQFSEPADVRQPAYIARVLKQYSERAPTTVPDQMAAIVKQAAADTTLKNARRDKAEFAWIPVGDTCPFCLSLAARGWQEAKKGVSAEHIHAHCNCQYAVRFDKKSGVAGYNPDHYKRIYSLAPGETSLEKINSLRREQYAENADEINAKKRAAYAARKERETDA